VERDGALFTPTINLPKARTQYSIKRFKLLQPELIEEVRAATYFNTIWHKGLPIHRRTPSLQTLFLRHSCYASTISSLGPTATSLDVASMGEVL